MRIPPAGAAISLPHHLWNSASELAMLLDGLDLSSVKRDIVAYLKSLRPEDTSRDDDHLSRVPVGESLRRKSGRTPRLERDLREYLWISGLVQLPHTL